MFLRIPFESIGSYYRSRQSETYLQSGEQARKDEPTHGQSSQVRAVGVSGGRNVVAEALLRGKQKKRKERNTMATKETKRNDRVFRDSSRVTSNCVHERIAEGLKKFQPNISEVCKKENCVG